MDKKSSGVKMFHIFCCSMEKKLMSNEDLSVGTLYDGSDSAACYLAADQLFHSLVEVIGNLR